MNRYWRTVDAILDRMTRRIRPQTSYTDRYRKV
jgi:hypothetical protein